MRSLLHDTGNSAGIVRWFTERNGVPGLNSCQPQLRLAEGAMAKSTPDATGNARLERITSDASVLLEYLGQKADSRLQSHFDDTRPQLAAPVARLAVPPCRSYKHFLNRMTHIILGEATTPEERSAAKDGDEDLDDCAFLYHARDFLAAVAGPATVETIQMTKAYTAARRSSPLSRLFWESLCSLRLPRPPFCSASVIGNDHALVFGARRLAKRVVRYERLALMILLVTLLVSVYAFAGRSILASQKQIFADYQSIGSDLGSYIKDIRFAKADATQRIDFPPRGCDAHFDAGPSPTQVASNSPVAPGSYGRMNVLDMDPRLCGLYWRLSKGSQDITTVTLHLNSWSTVAFRLYLIGDVFGVDDDIIKEVASRHGELCDYVRRGKPASDDCVATLDDFVHQATEVAESLLHSITLYMLPTLYGCLGALMASLRNIRRKVELSVLAQTDRGRLRQDVILGTLCGAVMGLFTGYFAQGTASQGLGLSALALLAGYNVPAVFGFLEGLSSRVFQTQKSAAASS